MRCKHEDCATAAAAEALSRLKQGTKAWAQKGFLCRHPKTMDVEEERTFHLSMGNLLSVQWAETHNNICGAHPRGSKPLSACGACAELARSAVLDH
jgi:hypothetical protein